MRCACSKCGYQLESLIIDKAVALQDISKKLNRHLEKDHKDMVVAMGQAMNQGVVGLAFVAPFAEFVMVPEQEEYILEKLQEGKDIVMALLGYDPTEDEEEDLEDDEEERDDSGTADDDFEDDEEGNAAKSAPENLSTNVVELTPDQLEEKATEESFNSWDSIHPSQR